MPTTKTWWKEAIVYQIYPRSFKDSNGDGIGDLKGIISKLDYIKNLGVTVVWLNPIYDSPNEDNGYDISNYETIMQEFGTMEDFDVLLKGLHDRGIKLIMDLVVNHCSDEHHWFKESRKSRDNKYRDYFHWVPAENGKPNERWSWFEESAWTYDKTTHAYYLHYFAKKQPDLKWENPQVRQDIYKMMHFWLKKGIDGFRMDVITLLSKDITYPERPEIYKDKHWEYFYAFGPKLQDYLEEMNREVLSHYDIMTIGEGPGLTTENVLDLVTEDSQMLNMAYNFEQTYIGVLPRKMLGENYQDLVAFKRIQSKWDATLNSKGWGAIYLGNHDQPRMLTRWVDDSPEWNNVSSKMLNTWLLTMRGTPYLFQGDEIGMSNIKFNTIEDYRDIETINLYQQIKKEGGDTAQFIESNKITSRDNARTPIQWDNSKHGGFTKGKPWIKVNANYNTINVLEQENNTNSVLQYFRQLVQLRKDNAVFTYGNYEVIDIEHPQVYAYTRTLDKESVLVVLNFIKETVNFTIPSNKIIDQLLLSNYSNSKIINNTIALHPFQASIFKLK